MTGTQVPLALAAFGMVVVPGMAAHVLLGRSHHLALMSVALGYAVLVITQVPVRVFRIAPQVWLLAVATVSVVVLAGWCSHRLRVVAKPGAIVGPLPRQFAVGSIVVAGAWSLYWLLVGGYTEVPSDFWNHLARIRYQLDSLNAGRLMIYEIDPSQLINRDYVHGLHSLLAWESRLSLLDSVDITAYVATLIFLLATLWFGLAVFERDGLSDRRRLFASLLAVAFVWVFQGIGPFSFVRYYGVAPAIVGFVMYYAFIVGWLDLIRGSIGIAAGTARLAILAAGMLLAHQQEFGFAIVMSCMTLGTCLLLGIPEDSTRRRKALWMVLVCFVALAVAVSVGLMIRGDPGPIGSSKVLHLGRYLPLFEDMFILNPGYQFVQVFGAFGLIVTAAALLAPHYLSRNPFLIAGLLLPLFTVFNPLFVYVYLHVAKYETLWRILFAVPLPFIAAALLVRYIESIPRLTVRIRIAGALVAVLAAVSLLPVEFSGFRNANSRIGSLVDTRAQGVQWLPDVVEFLNSMPAEVAYTDPVTAYVLRGATVHIVPGWKFYAGRSGVNFEQLKRDGIVEQFLESRPGLYVINKRPAGETRNGQDSGHWRSDVLDTSRWYPDGFDELLAEHGAILLYDANGVRVYAIGLA